MIRRLLAPLLLATLALPALAGAEAPKPLLWKVSDADNEVYLLGSFHMLKPTDYPLAATADAAFADAERVVFELSPEEANSPTLGPRLQQTGQRSDGGTLQQSLPPELWRKLEAYLAARIPAGAAVPPAGPAAGLQSFDAWFVGLILAMGELQALGLDPKLGLDRHFIDRAVAAGKATEGLETGDQQIAMFEGMGPAEQIAMLEDTLDEAVDMRTRIELMHTLWRAGDADGLAKETMDELRSEYPKLYARINTERNLAWLPVVQKMLDDSDSDDTLVVVGSMHLLGADGLVELLRAKGYTVERL